MAVRTSEAIWEGDLENGHGTMELGSRAWQGPYSFSSRFEHGQGTNPEELLAAAHAGCFSMALAAGLSKSGHPPTRVHTTAKVHLNKSVQGYYISRVDLSTEATVPGIDDHVFQEQAQNAKRNCPVSQLFRSAEIRLTEARLVGEPAPVS